MYISIYIRAKAIQGWVHSKLTFPRSIARSVRCTRPPSRTRTSSSPLQSLAWPSGGQSGLVVASLSLEISHSLSPCFPLFLSLSLAISHSLSFSPSIYLHIYMYIEICTYMYIYMDMDR